MFNLLPNAQDTIVLDAYNGGQIKIPRRNILSMKIERGGEKPELIVNYITGDREILPLTEHNQRVFDEF